MEHRDAITIELAAWCDLRGGRPVGEAHALAEQLAAFPQTCLRQDRLSAYEQHGLPLAEAMAKE